VSRMAAALCLTVALVASPVAANHLPLTLTQIAALQVVEVSVDMSRFPRDRVAIIEIKNPNDFPVRGFISRCDTVFRPEDSSLAALLPAESGDFIVRPRQRVRIARLFRSAEPGKRLPDGAAAYKLAPAPSAYEATWNCTE